MSNDGIEDTPEARERHERWLKNRLHPDETAFIGLAQGDNRTLGQRIDDEMRQRAEDRFLRDVVRDNRGGSVHDRGTTTLPRSTEPETAPLPKSSGWRDQAPLATPHVAACDRLLDAQDARDLRQRLREEK